MKPVNHKGRVFGRLTAIEYLGKSYWRCVCECGETRDIKAQSLVEGKQVSCGCYNKELASALNRTHGLTKHPLFKTWDGMMSRCNDPNNKDYVDYGGRGIKVCKRWHKVENFIKDMGERPEGKTLDRRLNSLGYSPANCRWATKLEQGSNKRNARKGMVDGKVMHLASASREFGIPENTLRNRMNKGMTLEEAVKMKPLRVRSK